MTLIYENGRQYITNAAGQIVFDTDERMFTAPVFSQGSIGLPSFSYKYNADRPRSDSYRDANTLLAAVPASCNVAIGMMRIDSGAWVVANGTHLDQFKFGGPTGVNMTYWWYVRGIRALTFLVSGGGLYLNERTILCPATDGVGGGQTYSISGSTLYWRLYVGTFN